MAIVRVRKVEEFPLVAPGVYTARIISDEERDGRILFKLEIVGGEFDGQWLFYSAPVEGKGAYYLSKFIQAAMNNPELESDSFNTSQTIGHLIEVSVEHDHHDGKVRPKIMAFEPASNDLPF